MGTSFSIPSVGRDTRSPLPTPARPQASPRRTRAGPARISHPRVAGRAPGDPLRRDSGRSRAHSRIAQVDTGCVYGVTPRKLCCYLPAAFGGRSCRECAAAGAYAFVEAAEAVPGPEACEFCGARGCCVSYLHGERAGGSVQAYVHRCSRCVAKCVCEALLHHAVCGLDDGGGQALAFSFQPHRHVEAATGGSRNELFHECQVGHRSVCVIVAQEFDEPADVVLGWRAAPAIASKVSSMSSGALATRRCPAVAWTTMTLIAWATMSCSSEASRARS